jgi:uncharacterized pyridoxamine 5'-phosphate oxidase family protein
MAVILQKLFFVTHKDDKFVINHVAKNKEVSFIVLKTRAMMVCILNFTDSKTNIGCMA